VERRFVVLIVLAVCELLAMTLWFSASAVVPDLQAVLDIDTGDAAWLTMSVQLGFVAGALVSATLGISDRVSTPLLFAGGALVGALVNAAVPALEPGFLVVVGLRFLTGVCLAFIYPTGMKLMASWFPTGRGFAIGVLVGALTVGSAAPHLLRALPGFAGVSVGWQQTMYAASALAVVAGLVSLLFLREGPALARAARFSFRDAGALFTDKPLFLANLGYLGHMWELYAMWTWAPVLLLQVFATHGGDPDVARALGFATVAIGSVGCVLAGLFADRVGRTLAAGVSLVVSGTCCLFAGFVTAPALLVAVCLVWGFFVVADSAQFSAAVSELGDPRHVGSLLTMQTSSGFVLTLVSIRLVPWLQESYGWGAAFASLAVGPVVGAWAMRALRALPEAERMAGGRG
jgi:MFS family permease